MNNRSMKRYFPIFALPTLIAFIVGFVVPFILGVYLSFCKFTTVTDAQWIGFSNYTKIFLMVIFFMRSASQYCSPSSR